MDASEVIYMYGMPTNQEEDVLKKYGRDITNDVKTRKTDPMMKFVVLREFYLEKRRIIRF